MNKAVVQSVDRTLRQC